MKGEEDYQVSTRTFGVFFLSLGFAQQLTDTSCTSSVGNEKQWRELLPKIPLSGNSHHYYGLQASDEIYTHVRLNMYPDGGIVSFFKDLFVFHRYLY